MSLAIEPFQVVRLGRDMGKYIIFHFIQISDEKYLIVASRYPSSVICYLLFAICHTAMR